MEQIDIGRTAFPRISNSSFKSAYGTASRDQNDMCPYCKNENTDAIRDASGLMPFEMFYAKRRMTFKALSCHCCGAVFSHYTKESAETQ